MVAGGGLWLGLWLLYMGRESGGRWCYSKKLFKAGFLLIRRDSAGFRLFFGYFLAVFCRGDRLNAGGWYFSP